MYARKLIFDLVTNGSGAAEAFSEIVSGRIQHVIYQKAQSNGFDNGVDFSITIEGTGETVYAKTDVNDSVNIAPRRATHTTDGTAAVYASGGSPVLDHIVAAQDRIKVNVASGGSAKQGRVIVIIG